MSLFLIECKKILKSYIYYIFIGVILLFYISQMGFTNLESIKNYADPPKSVDIEQYYVKNHVYPYGEKNAELSIDTIPKVTKNLYIEYSENRYTTYPLGFAKIVRLNDSKANEIKKVLTEITGDNIDNLNKVYNVYHINPKFPVSSSLTISRFKELMTQIDKVLGGGSSYSKNFITGFTTVPITYEEAVQNYKYLLNNDKLTNGYARLFCDYIGIVVGIFPIFVAVSMALKDKRSKMNELVYSRNTSSIKLILSRYFALVVMMIIPILLISFEPLIQFIRFSAAGNIPIDVFAFIKYILWWLLPTLMIVTAIGIFLSTLTNTAAAIAVQLFIWFLNISTIRLIGDYPTFGFFIRHNDGKMGTLIRDNAASITMNRLIITLIALILVTITTYVYEQKRRGKFDFNTKDRKLFKFNSSKSKV